jgi:hypothetical protein
MIKNVRFSNCFLCVLILIFLIFSLSCSGLGTIRSFEDADLRKDTPIGKKYRKIIFQKFEIDPNLEKDYPEITTACESTAMNELLRKSSITTIQKARLSASREEDALIIRTTVITLRMFSGTARTLDGTFTGNSEMAVDVQLIDAASRRTVREKKISTANNAYIASPAVGSDRSLPYDLGRMIAEYIAEVVRNQ